MSHTPIHALVLDGAGGARPATPLEIDQGIVEDGVLWQHLDYSEEATRRWLQDDSGLSEVLVEALLVGEPRPRSLVSGSGLLVVLRGINTNPGAEPEDMVSVRLWVEQGRMISLRHRKLGAPQEIVDQLISGSGGPKDAGELLHELADRLLDRIGIIVQGIEDATDDLEERVLSDVGRELRTQLSDLRRQSISLRRYIAPQRDMLSRLHSERVTWMSEVARARLRECADRVTRYQETLDASRERAAVTYEELSNRLAEQMNQTMYILSIMAAIFLPLGLVTGLLGINVGGMPGADRPWAFALVTVLLIVGGVLEWLWFKRHNIL
ncbi:MAG: zinc transporter [Myxococcota bacterium]|jgi:zinc transporter